MTPRTSGRNPLATLAPGGPLLGTLLGYGAMIAVAVALFLLVRHAGADLAAPPAPADAATPHPTAHASVLAHVLLALAAIALAARAFGAAFERFLGQPPVIGEIVAGIVLGPSVLGALSPAAQTLVLPVDAAPHLGIIAKLGVVLFMFLVGLELDGRLLRGTSHATLAISHASIVVPFVLGSMLALVLYPRYSHSGVDFTVFALFCGVSMSVTAFPVLARILTDRRMHSTSLGVTALACAAVDDATAWCLLALVSGVATAEVGSAGLTLALVLGFVVVMVTMVRPLARRLADRQQSEVGPVRHGILAIVLAGILLCAAATEAIGIHALFGAFLLGAVMPHEGRLASELRARLEDVVVVLLLPVFFAFTGLRTQLSLVSGADDWLLCGVIIVVATLGKFGGTLAAARFTGLRWREGSALGVLMNTRGLMELIVLNVGLDMGVLSPRLFAMLVVMALVTTFATTPILGLILRPGAHARGTT